MLFAYRGMLFALPCIMGMLFACKALLDEDILRFFQFQCCGITLSDIKNNKRRQVYRRHPAHDYERRANRISRW